MLNNVNKFLLICINIFLSFMILPNLAISDELQVYSRKVKEGNRDIYIKIHGEEKPLVIHEADDLGPILSPEKDKVGFKSNRDGQYKVYVINIDGTNLRDIDIGPSRYDPIPQVNWIDNNHLRQVITTKSVYFEGGKMVHESKWVVYSFDVNTGLKEVIDGGREIR